ncbi:unnamed protein product [Anisakis simplex]|uniref:Homeobox protein ceh-5 (inferred by orthology to a C. elegans protein) n=1 Tax=Anisakis simplex TaxID=6269 RepID=A0A0M3KHC9_ANISI|nr:unnamed protein product [Anisakis simplex]
MTFADSKGEVREMLFPKALDLYRPKRPRTTFSTYQLNELEKEYEQNPYLIGEDRVKLADKLKLTDTQVMNDSLNVSRSFDTIRMSVKIYSLSHLIMSLLVDTPILEAFPTIL